MIVLLTLFVVALVLASPWTIPPPHFVMVDTLDDHLFVV